MEDEKILVQEAKKDPEAFGHIYDAFYQPIFGFMYSRTGNAEIAKDLTSETFFQALKHMDRFQPRKGISIKSWLFAIAVAQIGNFYRSRSRMFELVTDSAPDIIAQDDVRPDIAYQIGEDAVELEQQILLLRRSMRKLNEKQQNILSLRYFSHMSVPEIAQILHMKEGTIKSHIHRALKKLQNVMTATLVESNNFISYGPSPQSTQHRRTSQAYSLE